MNEQPEALRLADALEGHAKQAWTREEAAAELRRLHDETQMLEHAYESACKLINEQDKKLAELEAVNRELLAALKDAVAVIGLAENSVRCNYYKYEREFRALITKIETQ
jgi:hypothetical protein